MPLNLGEQSIDLLYVESSEIRSLTSTASKSRILLSKLRRHGVKIACSLEVLQETLATRDAVLLSQFLGGLRAIRSRLVGLPSFTDVLCIHNHAQRLPRRAVEESTRILLDAIDGTLPQETLNACYERGIRFKQMAKDADAKLPPPTGDLDLLLRALARSRTVRRYAADLFELQGEYGPNWKFRCRSRTSKPLQAFAVANATRIAMRAASEQRLPGHIDMFQTVYLPFVPAVAQRDTGFRNMARTVCQRLHLPCLVTTWASFEAALFA